MVHLSWFILVFEILSVLALPLLIFGNVRGWRGCRRATQAWLILLVSGSAAQLLLVGRKRGFSYPMVWSLDRPTGLRQDPVPPRWFGTETPVYLSRPPVKEVSPGHTCYDVFYSNRLAEWLRSRDPGPVKMRYVVVYSFDTRIGVTDPQIEGFGGASYSQETIGNDFWGDNRTYWCFPPTRGLLR